MLEHKWGPAKDSLQSESNFLCILSKVSSLDRFIGELQEEIQMINGELGMIAIIFKDIFLISQLIRQKG